MTRPVRHDLTEPEGVNAGSARSTAHPVDGCGSTPAAVREGGRPSAADAQDRDQVRHDQEREVIAGPWGSGAERESDTEFVRREEGANVQPPDRQP